MQNLGGDRVLLYNISWHQFERLLENLGENRSARFAYDDGTLEIMTPSPEHEYYRDILGDAVKDIADEVERDYECYGSTTWRRELKKQALNPITAFISKMKRSFEAS